MTIGTDMFFQNISRMGDGLNEAFNGCTWSRGDLYRLMVWGDEKDIDL